MKVLQQALRFQCLDCSSTVITLSAIIQTAEIQTKEIMAGIARISMTASVKYKIAEHANLRHSNLSLNWISRFINIFTSHLHRPDKVSVINHNVVSAGSHMQLCFKGTVRIQRKIIYLPIESDANIGLTRLS